MEMDKIIEKIFKVGGDKALTNLLIKSFGENWDDRLQQISFGTWYISILNQNMSLLPTSVLTRI
jgi:hypothetical protein